MSDFREEIVEVIAEGVFHGIMKFEDFRAGQADKVLTAQEEKMPKQRKPRKKKEPEPEADAETEELDDEDDELDGDDEAMDFETMMIAIKTLIADYVEGPEAGKELAITTLESGYNVKKFKDLEPKVFPEVVKMMTEALS